MVDLPWESNLVVKDSCCELRTRSDQIPDDWVIDLASILRSVKVVQTINKQTAYLHNKKSHDLQELVPKLSALASLRSSATCSCQTASGYHCQNSYPYHRYNTRPVPIGSQPNNDVDFIKEYNPDKVVQTIHRSRLLPYLSDPES